MENIIINLLSLIIIAILTFRKGFLNGPLEKFEESVHLSWSDALFHGKLPYRDYYINYGFLYTLHFFIAYKIFGKTLKTHRMVIAVGHYLSVVIAYGLGTYFIESNIGRLLLAVTLPIFSLDQRYLTCWGGFRFGAGLLSILALFLGFYYDSNLFFLISGILTGLTVFFSQDEAVSVILAMIGIIIYNGIIQVLGVGNPISLYSISLVIIGGSLVVIPIIIVFLYKGVFGKFYHDAFIGIKNMGKWRGGYTFFLNPYKYAGSNINFVNLFFNEAIFYYASMLLVFVILIHTIFGVFTQNILISSSSYLLIVLFLVSKLFSSIRVVDGPQFKTALPSFVIISLSILFTTEINFIFSIVMFIFFISFITHHNFKYLKRYYWSLRKKSFIMKDYSGVLIPDKMANIMIETENKLRELTTLEDEILAIPYDASPIFFADRKFYGRHSIAMVFKLFEDDYSEFIENLNINPPKYILFSGDAPDLLSGQMYNRNHLKEVYEIIENRYEILHSVSIPNISKDEMNDIRQAWPGCWFWFNKNKELVKMEIMKLIEE